jgi:hypothetical protein
MRGEENRRTTGVRTECRSEAGCPRAASLAWTALAWAFRSTPTGRRQERAGAPSWMNRCWNRLTHRLPDRTRLSRGKEPTSPSSKTAASSDSSSKILGRKPALVACIGRSSRLVSYSIPSGRLGTASSRSGRCVRLQEEVKQLPGPLSSLSGNASTRTIFSGDREIFEKTKSRVRRTGRGAILPSPDHPPPPGENAPCR